LELSNDLQTTHNKNEFKHFESFSEEKEAGKIVGGLTLSAK